MPITYAARTYGRKAATSNSVNINNTNASSELKATGSGSGLVVRDAAAAGSSKRKQSMLESEMEGRGGRKERRDGGVERGERGLDEDEKRKKRRRVASPLSGDEDEATTSAVVRIKRRADKGKGGEREMEKEVARDEEKKKQKKREPFVMPRPVEVVIISPKKHKPVAREAATVTGEDQSHRKRPSTPVRGESSKADDSTISHYERPKVKVTYGTPKKETRVFNEDGTPAKDVRDLSISPLSSPSGTPRKPKTIARDLTSLFEAAKPKRTNSQQMETPRKKLTQRMLARSKTDTAVSTPSERLEAPKFLDRTASLPTLLPSFPRKASPALTEEANEDTVDPFPSLPVRKPTNTRTYAGKSRSFLVALPASEVASTSTSKDGLFGQPQGENDENDDSNRESYSALRLRWGVDVSEDDPYEQPSPLPSPSRKVATPKGTPSKGKKGKASASAPIGVAPEALPPGMMNPLKSITELRSKGESRRFLDEVGYLFEGLEAGTESTGIRRASAFEVTAKMCDPEFLRKAKAADFFTRAYEVFLKAGAGTGGDQILDILFAFFVALVARDPASIRDLAQRSLQDSQPSSSSLSPGFVETLIRVLEPLSGPNPSKDTLRSVSDLERNTKDPKASAEGERQLKRAGIGKKERALLSSIHSTIVKKSRLFPPETSLTLPLLITHALIALPETIIPSKILPPLLRSLKTELGSAEGVPSHILDHEVPLASVYAHLTLLDGYLLGQWGASSRTDSITETAEYIQALGNARSSWLLDALFPVALRAELLLRKDDADADEDMTSQAIKCLEIVLRVLVTLTHKDAEWSNTVLSDSKVLGMLGRLIANGTNGFLSQPATNKGEKYVNSDGVAEADNHTLDRLYLALGLLTNLIQAGKGPRAFLQGTSLDVSCSLTRLDCAFKCVCPNRINILEILLRLYTQQLQKRAEGTPSQEENADRLLLCGHLAILFGLLMRGPPLDKEFADRMLSSRSKGNKRGRLQDLIEDAQRFADFLEATSGKSSDREDSSVARSIVSFLQGMAIL